MPVKPARQPVGRTRAYLEASRPGIEQSQIDTDRQAAIEWSKGNGVTRLRPGTAWGAWLQIPKAQQTILNS